MKARLMSTTAVALLGASLFSGAGRASESSYATTPYNGQGFQSIDSQGVVTSYDYVSNQFYYISNGAYYTSAPDYSVPFPDTTDVFSYSYNMVTGGNSSGNSVGSYVDPCQGQGCVNNSAAFTYIGGTFSASLPPIPVSLLPNGTLGGDDEPYITSSLSGINDANVAVGSYEYSGADSSGQYTEGQGGYTETDGTYSEVSSSNGISINSFNGINDSGTIYGQGSDSDGNSTYFTYANGSATAISDPSLSSLVVDGINNDGSLYGTAVDSSGNAVTFIDQDGTFTTQVIDLPGATPGNIYLEGVNSQGYAVGIAGLTGGSFVNFETAPVAGPLVLGAPVVNTIQGSSDPGSSTDVPEPTRLAMLFGLAFLMLVAVRSRFSPQA